MRDAITGDVDRTVDVGPYQVLFWPNGDVGFAHDCTTGGDQPARAAPLLRLRGQGHEIVSDDPLTVVPSIHCPGCGTHGWITDGAWVPAKDPTAD